MRKSAIARSNVASVIILGAGALLGATGPARAGANLVLNGTFAAGFADWTQTTTGTVNAPEQIEALGTGNPFFPADPLTVGSPEVSPTKAAYFETDTGTQTLSQKLTLSVGTYSIGFDLDVPSNGFANPSDVTFSASIAGTPLLASSSIGAIGAADGTNTWVNVTSVADVATAGDYEVDFTFTGASSGAAKDVAVTRVFAVQGDVLPEPSALGLLAVPMLGLAALRRRAKGAFRD